MRTVLFPCLFAGALFFLMPPATATGGQPEPITQLDETENEVSHRLPHALPDGDTILFVSVVGSAHLQVGTTAIEALVTLISGEIAGSAACCGCSQAVSRRVTARAAARLTGVGIRCDMMFPSETQFLLLTGYSLRPVRMRQQSYSIMISMIAGIPRSSQKLNAGRPRIMMPPQKIC